MGAEAAAFWFYIKPNYMDPKPPPVYTEEQIAEAPRPTVYLGKAVGEAPLLDDVLAWIDCELETVHEAGDHDIVIGRVHDLAVTRESSPLVFFRGGYV